MPGGTDPQLWLSAFKRGDKETFVRTIAAAVGEGSVKFSGQSALVCINNVLPGYKALLAPRNGKTVKGQQNILRLLVEGAVPFPGPPHQVQLPGPAPPSPRVAEGNAGSEPIAESQDVEPDDAIEANEQGVSVSGEQQEGESRQSRREGYLELVKQLSEVMARYEAEIERLEIDISKFEEELGDEQISNDEVLASARSFSKIFKRYRARKQQLVQLKQTMSDCHGKIQEKLIAVSQRCNTLKKTLQKANVQVNSVKHQRPEENEEMEPTMGSEKEESEEPTLPLLKKKRRKRGDEQAE
jgi:hypothetical protein